jgi:hypothetical protein
MTECTPHLAGLWISAAISNMSHSNKAGSITVKQHGSQVKGQGQRQCCHNKHKKFPYWPTRDVSLLSRHASYLEPNDDFYKTGASFSDLNVFITQTLDLGTGVNIAGATNSS